MVRVVKVFGRVLVLRRITASHVATDQAHAQMNPSVSGFQTLLTSGSAWPNFPDLVEMTTAFHAQSPLADRVSGFAYKG